MALASAHATLTLPIVFVTLATATSGGDWHQQALYNSQVNLTCADESYKPENHSQARYQWILPDGTILDPQGLPPNSKHQFTFSGSGGSTLTIEDVERPNFGLYTCLVFLPPYTQGVYAAVRKGINMDGPYFGDLHEKYMPNIKTGLFAGFFVMVVMSMVCYNYDQFQERHDIRKPVTPVSPRGVTLQNYASAMMGPLPEMEDNLTQSDFDVQELPPINYGVDNQAFEAEDGVVLREIKPASRTSF